MPRYMVVRDFGKITDEQIQEVLASSTVTKQERFPDLEWESTQVCDDAEGGVKAFCIYTAPSSERLYEHAQTIDHPTTHRIFEIVGDIRPDDVSV